MGTLYSIFVLDDIIDTDEGVEWLQRWDIDLPKHLPPGREPTLGEINQALAAEGKHELEYLADAESLHVTISSNENDAWAALVVTNYDKEKEDLDKTYQFHFEAGWLAVIREIVQSLANMCGPFILTKNGEDLEILMPK